MSTAVVIVSCGYQRQVMVHSIRRLPYGCAGKTEWSLNNMCHIWALPQL